jgi:hypothetical protein
MSDEKPTEEAWDVADSILSEQCPDMGRNKAGLLIDAHTAALRAENEQLKNSVGSYQAASHIAIETHKENADLRQKLADAERQRDAAVRAAIKAGVWETNW